MFDVGGRWSVVGDQWSVVEWKNWKGSKGDGQRANIEHRAANTELRTGSAARSGEREVVSDQ